MTGQCHRGTTKILVSAAIVLGYWVGGAAPASADPDPVSNGPNPFGTLGCSCRESVAWFYREHPVLGERPIDMLDDPLRYPQILHAATAARAMTA
jgi:hypothetical protein